MGNMRGVGRDQIVAENEDKFEIRFGDSVWFRDAKYLGDLDHKDFLYNNYSNFPNPLKVVKLDVDNVFVGFDGMVFVFQKDMLINEAEILYNREQEKNAKLATGFNESPVRVMSEKIDCVCDGSPLFFDRAVVSQWTWNQYKNKTKEEVMKKCISSNFDKTADALLVEKHLGGELSNDNFITNLIVKQFGKEILAEAKRIEEESLEEKK